MDIAHDRRNRKLSRGRLRLSESDLKVVQRARIKHQAADVFYHLPALGIEESLLEDDIRVVMNTEVQSGREKTKTDAKTVV